MRYCPYPPHQDLICPVGKTVVKWRVIRQWGYFVRQIMGKGNFRKWDYFSLNGPLPISHMFLGFPTFLPGWHQISCSESPGTHSWPCLLPLSWPCCHNQFQGLLHLTLTTGGTVWPPLFSCNLGFRCDTEVCAWGFSMPHLLAFPLLQCPLFYPPSSWEKNPLSNQKNTFYDSSSVSVFLSVQAHFLFWLSPMAWAAATPSLSWGTWLSLSTPPKASGPRTAVFLCLWTSPPHLASGAGTGLKCFLQATCHIEASPHPYLDTSTFGDHDLPHTVEAVEVGLWEARGQDGAPALREVASTWHWEGGSSG